MRTNIAIFCFAFLVLCFLAGIIGYKTREKLKPVSHSFPWYLQTESVGVGAVAPESSPVIKNRMEEK